MTQLLHQLGHNYCWNIDSLTAGIGDGVIIGPRYIERTKVMSLPFSIRRNAIFDPQFYLPNSSEGYLSKYPFFPQVVAGGFSTTEWNEELAYESASQCLLFQSECEFEYIVIPTRYREGMPSDYIESQAQHFVAPFIRAYGAQNLSNPCLLQLILTDQMLKDNSYRRDILNWVTSIEELDGIYLICPWSSKRKQIEDIDFLLSVMAFVRDLKTANMAVIMGYVNTESILYLAADPDAITMGSYENLRMFGIRPYEPKEDKKMQGPTPRIYVSRLLQWIEHQYIGAIVRSVENGESFFDDNQHRIIMFEPTYKWHFSKPDPYKHYFVSFSQQFHRLISYNGQDRFDAIRAEFQCAIRNFHTLDDLGIAFNNDSSGNHLPAWLTALNLFERTNP